MIKIVIVGQSPGASAKPGDQLLSGACGRRLAEMMGLTFEDYLGRTERYNLLDRWPGRAPGGADLFPSDEAAVAAENLMRSQFTGRRVLMLGRGVARAFGVHDPWLTWSNYLCVEGPNGSAFCAAVVPHPSGLNRWWNEAANEAAARAFLTAAAEAGG